MAISHFTKSQSYSIGLRCGESVGHFKYSTLSVIFKKPDWDDLTFWTRCVIPVEAAITQWLNSGHKGMDTSSENIQVGYSV